MQIVNQTISTKSAMYLLTDRCVTDSKVTKVYMGVYLHGKLQNHIGYDIVAILNCDESLFNFLPKGVKSVILRDIDGVDYFARLYYWKNKYKQHRGLVVFEQDQEANQYATEKMDLESDNL